MRLHLPKPLHGWREFVGEVGIIVLGVLLALGAEQIIVALNDRKLAAESRRDVREEVAFDLGFYRERLAESGCVATRLASLSAILQRGIVKQGEVTWVGRPNDFAPFSERWRAVTSSARTALFPPQEQESLDAIYGIFGRMDLESQAEQAAWTDLNVLTSVHGAIDPLTRFSLLRALAQARRSDDVLQFVSTFIFFHVKRLQISSDPATSPHPGDAHSVCLPLSADPGQAAKLLAPRSPQ